MGGGASRHYLIYFLSFPGPGSGRAPGGERT